MSHPPKPPPEPPRWSTWIGDRTPQIKMHTSLGKAKLAVGNTLYGRGMRGGVIYKWVNDQWNEYAVVERGQQKIDHPLFQERVIKEAARKKNRSHKWEHAHPNAAFCSQCGERLYGF